MSSRVVGSLGAFVGTAIVVALATAFGHFLGANPLTVAFGFILIVLFGATWRGLALGLWAALLSTASLNYYFLPPVGTFRIAEPSNWVALLAFTTVAAIAGRLVAQAREQAELAEQRARAIEVVHGLTLEVLARPLDPAALAIAASRALLATGARAAGVIVERGEKAELLAWVGEDLAPSVRQRLTVADAALQSLESGEVGKRDVLAPLLVRGAKVGVLAGLGTPASRQTVEAIAKVLALALERERLVEEQALGEAIRRSEELKTALLRAVSHDLSTPLAAIGFQIDSLKRRLAGHEAASAVNELEAESARLRRRIEGLLSLGRLESGSVRPRPEPIPPADLFRSTRESFPRLERPVKIQIDANCPDAWADPSLALEIVVNLFENADRASPPEVAIELVAESHGREGIRIGVLDRGRGLAGASGEIAAGDIPPHGLGLEIARRFAAASGGRLMMEARAGGGIAAWVHLPAAAHQVAA